MDLNRLLTSLLNRFLRRALTKGINAGIDQVARRGKPPGPMTAAEADQARRARELAGRARQVAKLARRFGR